MRLSRRTMLHLAAAAAALFTAASVRADTKPVKIGLVAVNYNSPSINAITHAAMAAAKERGWEVELFDGRGDQVATNNAATNFIDRGFSAIINIASPNPQMSGVIKHANEAHVPFVSAFSGLVPGITAEIGSNNTADGVIATTEMIGRLSGIGHVVKMNWTVLPALRERDHGFHAVVQDYHSLKVTEIELKVPGQVDDAYNQMTNLLLANKDINAVWVGWDEVAAPVVRAIQQAHLENKIFVVSEDGDQAALDLIREGTPLVLTIAYDKERMGRATVDVTADALEGKQPPTRLLALRPCLITKDTVPPKGQPIDFKTCTLFSGEAALPEK
jgi:ribose transport system substrate-binding protein